MKTQRGFTLIELVMVIVILGILAATALPKFADLTTDAESAAVNGARGAVNSALAIGHAQSLIDGNGAAATSTISVEGVTYDMVYGYPSGDDGDANAQIDGLAGIVATDFTFSTTAAGPPSVMTFTKGACSFTYTEATAAAAASVSAVAGVGC